jgi:hypothetical protein
LGIIRILGNMGFFTIGMGQWVLESGHSYVQYTLSLPLLSLCLTFYFDVCVGVLDVGMICLVIFFY